MRSAEKIGAKWPAWRTSGWSRRSASGSSLWLRAVKAALLDESLLIEHLEWEVDQIAQVVAELQKADSSQREKPPAPYFMIEPRKIKECFSRSPAFKGFLTSSGESHGG